MRRQFETQLNRIVGDFGTTQPTAFITGAAAKCAQRIKREIVDRFIQVCAVEAEEQFKDIQSGVNSPDQAFNPFLRENENGLQTTLCGVLQSLKMKAAKNALRAAGKAENALLDAAEAGIQVYASTEFATGREWFNREILRLKSSSNLSPTAQAETDANSKTAKPVEQQADMLAAGGGASDEVQKRVAALERHQKEHAKPLTKTKKIAISESSSAVQNAARNYRRLGTKSTTPTTRNTRTTRKPVPIVCDFRTTETVRSAGGKNRESQRLHRLR